MARRIIALPSVVLGVVGGLHSTVPDWAEVVPSALGISLGASWSTWH